MHWKKGNFVLHLRYKTRRNHKSLGEGTYQKGYSSILCVSKRGLKLSKADISDVFAEDKEDIGKINDCIDILVQSSVGSSFPNLNRSL